MTTQQVADRLVELIRAGEHAKAQDELYSANIVSIENPVEPNDMMKYYEVTGMDAVKDKLEKWLAGVEEIHDAQTSDPLVSKNCFAINMTTDATFKDTTGMGRMKIEELGVYSVKGGKIVREEFIY